MSAAAGAGDAQYRKMTQTPIPRLVATLAVPTIISMLVTAVYNMADTFFVAQLGTSAAGAVGIVFSLMAVIQAIGFMLGMGAGNLVSRYLGAKEQRQADCAASTAFFTALAFGLGITVLGTLFLDPLMRVLGATPTILPYARDYARYILFGAPVMCASFVLNNILRGEGKAMLAMVGIGLGGVLNIGLDPLFIYTFGLGIAGAAIATLLSQCVSFAILLSCFLRRKSAVRLHIGQVSRKAEVYARIIKTGMPSFCRHSLATVATGLLNVNAAVVAEGRISVRDEKAPQLVVNRFDPLESFTKQAPPPMAAAPRPAAQEQAVLQASRLYLRLPSEQSPLFGKVRATLNMFPGNVTAVLYFADTGVRRGTQCGLRGDMLQELRALLGEDSVVLK